MQVLKLKVRFVVEPDDDSFHAYCPSLKGLHVDGATEEEAIENAKRAVEGYISSIIRHGDAIPIDMIEDESASVARAVWDTLKRKLARSDRHARIEEVCVPA
jgi:predicted RNase H-like HicB family nuclease